MKPDLLSLVLTLQPLGRLPPEKPPPRWWGRAAHALLLNTVKAYNPELSEGLHKGDGPRPFTASTLRGRFSKGQLDPEWHYTLRLTGLQKDVVASLLAAAKDGALAPSATVELDHIPFRVECVQPDQRAAISVQQSSGSGQSSASNFRNLPPVWAALTNYQELSAALLLAKETAPRRVRLRFSSPTTFKTGGKHVPVPLPDLVFGGLLERWNAFAPIAFPPEARRYAEECLAISRYKLSTRAVPVKSGGLRVGALGEATYVSLNYDRYWMSVIGVLAAFALFCGVGAGTSMGLGQCHLISD